MSYSLAGAIRSRAQQIDAALVEHDQVGTNGVW